MINVSSQVRDLIARSNVQQGIALVRVLHTTCGLLVNDAHSGWEEDMMAFLERIVPNLDFQHLHDGPEHAKSHILGALVGATTQIGIENGRPVLGTWQSVFLAEFEGPRERTVAVTIVGK